MSSYGSTGAKEPHFICPITGFPTPMSKRVWSRIHGQWVSPEGNDVRGYKQTEDYDPRPHPIDYTRRTRDIPDPITGD